VSLCTSPLVVVGGVVAAGAAGVFLWFCCGVRACTGVRVGVGDVVVRLGLGLGVRGCISCKNSLVWRRCLSERIVVSMELARRRNSSTYSCMACRLESVLVAFQAPHFARSIGCQIAGWES